MPEALSTATLPIENKRQDCNGCTIVFTVEGDHPTEEFAGLLREASSEIRRLLYAKLLVGEDGPRKYKEKEEGLIKKKPYMGQKRIHGTLQPVVPGQYNREKYEELAKRHCVKLDELVAYLKKEGQISLFYKECKLNDDGNIFIIFGSERVKEIREQLRDTYQVLPKYNINENIIVVLATIDPEKVPDNVKDEIKKILEMLNQSLQEFNRCKPLGGVVSEFGLFKFTRRTISPKHTRPAIPGSDIITVGCR